MLAFSTCFCRAQVVPVWNTAQTLPRRFASPRHRDKQHISIACNTNSVCTQSCHFLRSWILKMCLSVGDILALSDLAYKLLKALSDSRDSSKECLELMQELRVLSSSLDHTARIYSTIQDEFLDQAMTDAIAQLRVLIGKFMAKIEKYNSRPQESGFCSKFKRFWLRIDWVLLKEAEITKLRSRLANEKFNLNLNLILSSQYVQILIHVVRPPNSFVVQRFYRGPTTNCRYKHGYDSCNPERNAANTTDSGTSLVRYSSSQVHRFSREESCFPD